MAAMIRGLRRMGCLPPLNSPLVSCHVMGGIAATPIGVKQGATPFPRRSFAAINLAAHQPATDGYRALTTTALNKNASIIHSTQNIHQLDLSCGQIIRKFGSSPKDDTNNKHRGRGSGVRFSTLLSKHLGLSRRQSERMILTERVTLFGAIVNSPTFELFPSNDPNQNSSTAMKVDGKLVQGIEKTLKQLYEEQLEKEDSSSSDVDSGKGGKQKSPEHLDYSNTRIWLANKLKGELITENDPVGRPSMLERLTRGGVGKSKKKNEPHIHLKPVGRLDMMTEGLMIFTNDGKYARQLELPANQLWRTYRVRVHGRLTMGKLRALRKGVTVRIDDNFGGMEDKNPSGEVVRTGRMMKYKGIKVSIERKNMGSGRGGGGGTNTWLQITCTEGKNRMLRRMLSSLGLEVTRLIRISYGDYDLNTIPPGRAIEVNYKALEGMKKKGPMFVRNRDQKKSEAIKDEGAPAIEWVSYS